MTIAKVLSKVASKTGQQSPRSRHVNVRRPVGGVVVGSFMMISLYPRAPGLPPEKVVGVGLGGLTTF